jgi:hypothetical protein
MTTQSTTQSNPIETQTFTDKSGRAWLLELNFANARQIRTELQVDFGFAEGFAQTWGSLLYDEQKLLSVIWRLIKPAAGELTEDEWLANMDGERLETAREALLAAVENFTQPLKRELITTSTAKMMQVWREAVSESGQRIEIAMNEAALSYQKQLGKPQPESQAS